MSLSYFTDAETVVTSTGIPNIPTPQQQYNISFARKKMDEVRRIIGKAVNVNSWFRSPEVNKAVGGSPTSGHLSGFCIDYWVKGLTNQQICDLIDAAGIVYDQLIDEFDGVHYWVHISFDPRNRKQRLIARKKANGKMHYQPVLSRSIK
jgi:Peptidase M15